MPLHCGCDQSRPNRILPNVILLLLQALISAYSMIEKISLPIHAGEPRGGPFEIANDLRQRIFALNPDKDVQMVGHQQKQADIPTTARMITTCCFENRRRGGFVAKLINAAPVTANRHEINCGVTAGKMVCVIEGFPDRFRGPGVTHRAGDWGQSPLPTRATKCRDAVDDCSRVRPACESRDHLSEFLSAKERHRGHKPKSRKIAAPLLSLISLGK
jgi:hypothetical protein